MSNAVIRTLDTLDSIETVLPAAGTVLSVEAARLQDAKVALTDARRIAAALAEYVDLLERDMQDALNVQEIAGDVLPRLAAISEFVAEQVAEVTR